MAKFIGPIGTPDFNDSPFHGERRFFKFGRFSDFRHDFEKNGNAVVLYLFLSCHLVFSSLIRHSCLALFKASGHLILLRVRRYLWKLC